MMIIIHQRFIRNDEMLPDIFAILSLRRKKWLKLKDQLRYTPRAALLPVIREAKS